MLLDLKILLILAQAAPTQPAQSGPIALDSGAVERWADSLIQPALARSGVPGALLVVVRRSGIVLNKAWGVADLATGRPASADSTLFEYTSIGKTMTGLIASQLIDEGVLDPDADINRYLESARVSGPTVTLRMLLEHKGGFDDDITGLLTPFEGDVRMSRGELDRRLRSLIRPGFVPAYDNQGFGVIGLILRDVTGLSIPDLYRQRLFDPAGMTNAVQGRPADGMARLARCYTVQGPGAFHPCENWLYRDGMAGAGNVGATGADMARYLRLLLGGGSIDGKTVISPRAFADLTDWSHIRFHPGMPGGGHDFVQFEEFRGVEYAHSGSIPGFSSMLKVYADADVAILFTFLGGQPGGFDLTVSNIFTALRQVSVQDSAKPGLTTLREVTERFADRFIPADRPRSSEGPSRNPVSPDRIDDYLGRYVIASNHSRSFVSRLGGWGGLLTVERGGNDSVRLTGLGPPLEYRRVGPLLYENAKGDRLAFATLPIGPCLAIGLSGGVFCRTNWIESPAWSVPVFAVALLLLLTAPIQLRRRAPDSLRKLAAGSLLGALLLIGGLLAEWEWGVTLAIGRGSIAAPLLWRTAIHAGAGLLLWRAIGFARRRERVGALARAHGLTLAAAGTAMVLAVLAWRVLGAFPPYASW